MDYLALAENGKEIRLITLRWVEVKPEQDPLDELEVHEALTCDLEHCPFHGHDALPGVGDAAFHLPPVDTYVALSYTWNQDGRVKQLNINGHTVSIGQNLADAMQAFRRSDLLKDGYRLWADALCIDQNSIAERNREVPRMRAIYQRAKHVMIWLGQAEDDSDLVLDFANALSAAWSTDEQSTRAFLRIALENQGLRLFKAMTAFIERLYWLRIWVIQELAFASDDGPIHCGRRTTTWGKILYMYRACNLQHRTTSERLTDIFQQEFSRLPGEIRESYWREMKYWQWGKVEDFRELQLAVRNNTAIKTKLIVDRARKGGCTMLEDKIYGILGLLGSRISSRIQTDYSLPYVDTYRMFARAWIEGEQSLDVLHQCGNDPWTTGHDQPFPKNVPSWVPDLTFSKRIMTSSYEPE